ESPSIFKAFADGGAGVLGGAVFSAIPSADRIQHRLRLNMARKQGKKYFNELREGGALTREGQPNAEITRKLWRETSKNRNPQFYKNIPKIRELYSTGNYYGPEPNYKPRKDDIKLWHYFREPSGKMELQVGANDRNRVAYFLKELEGSSTKSTSIRFASLNNIIQPTLPKVNGIIERLLNPYGTGAAGSSLINALLNYKPSKKK
ncbi:MAG: hypothetical protein LBG46_07405, partial [Elusimicrobiota bacterium]|nr:hypothetical protein [Elusimicrobiota bacterium]